MKLEDIKSIAQLHSIKVNKVKKVELVRAIQQAEGNQPCFWSDNASVCEQQTCLWRSDCA